MLILTLLLVMTFFIGMNKVNANDSVDESEVFCRYLLGKHESSNALHGAWTGFWDKVSNVMETIGELIDTDLGFYEQNKMEHGYLANTLFDVVDNRGSIIVKQTESSSFYADFGDKLNHKEFYEDGDFSCPAKLYGKAPIQDKKTGRYAIILHSDKNDFHNEIIYVYNLSQGPTTRKDASGTVEIRDATCLGVLGSFKKDLDGALKIIRFVAPLIVVIYSTYDFVGALFSKDAELLTKATTRLRSRLILVAVLFFLPIVLNIILDITDTLYASCVY